MSWFSLLSSSLKLTSTFFLKPLHTFLGTSLSILPFTLITSLESSNFSVYNHLHHVLLLMPLALRNTHEQNTIDNFVFPTTNWRLHLWCLWIFTHTTHTTDTSWSHHRHLWVSTLRHSHWWRLCVLTPLTITPMMSLNLQPPHELTNFLGAPCQGRGPFDTTPTHNTCTSINIGSLPNSRV